MNILRLSRNFTIIAFLLSLIFHIITIFYIFIQKTRNSPISTNIQENQEKPEKQHKHPSWVETKARAGSFGAPVFFDDNHEEDELTLEQKNHLAKDDFEEEILSKKEPLEKKSIQDHNQFNSKKEASEKVTAIKNYAPPAQSKIMSPKKYVNKPISPVTHYNQDNRPLTAPRPPLTLAQLTQGFLHQRKQDSGTHSISMLGKEGLATDEQLKYERYLQKISWCIQNSFEINRSRFPSLSQNVTFKIFFAIARNGNLQQLAIHQSSGSIHIDQCVLFVFRDASTSFPPMPNYLPDDPLNIMYTFSIIVTPY